MKTTIAVILALRRLRQQLATAGAGSAAVLLGLAVRAETQGNPRTPDERPVIEAIHSDATGVHVTARVPANHRRVYLEGRPRLGAGTWSPRAVLWNENAQPLLTFHLPPTSTPTSASTSEMELLRVRGELVSDANLPSRFFHGPSQFGARKSAPSGSASVPTTATATAAVDSPEIGANSLTVSTALTLDSGVVSPHFAFVDFQPVEFHLFPLFLPFADLPSRVTDHLLIANERLLRVHERPPSGPEITLASPDSPHPALAVLSLSNSIPLVGASWHLGRLALLQLQPETWRTETIEVTNQVVTEIAQPPLRIASTNYEIVEVPQPPLLSYRWITVVIPYPPLPGDPNPPRIETNRVQITVKTPQPPILVTNEFLAYEEIPQPPRLFTNSVVLSSSTQKRVPGEMIFSLFSTDHDRLELVGQYQSAPPPNVGEGSCQAFWSQPDVVIWSAPSSLTFPLALPVSVETIASGGGTVTLGSPLMITSWVTPTFLRPAVDLGFPRLLAFDLRQPTSPTLASVTPLGEGQAWSSHSELFEAEGKLYFSHRESRPAPSIEPPPTISIANPSTFLWNVWGTWEEHDFLDVIDFADPTTPVIRPPVDFPGVLRGISLEGQLVYAEGDSLDPVGDSSSARSLHALAYDGLATSLISSLPLPNEGSALISAQVDGSVLLAHNHPNAGSRGALETWVLSPDAVFERRSTTELPAPATQLRTRNDLLLVMMADRVAALDLNQLPLLPVLGMTRLADKPDIDGSNTDGNTAMGLWTTDPATGFRPVALDKNP